ncbi:hypothetical protein EV702DRAFT_1205898 [Suillus placidus]|uniref:Uncharacterized protein n=1 Tax=Suillus placidus TaxID=48579 RepID=A0A9P7CVA3_9AGAM|nr:hypothetical protein EV702DRAFT_1205898 [Suillus placidus]
MPIIGTTIFGFGLMTTFLPIQLYLVDTFTYAASATAAASLYGTIGGTDETARSKERTKFEHFATLEEASCDPESSQASHPHRRRSMFSKKDRLEALARKDETWYPCHILNSCVSTGGPKDGPGSTLNGALLDGAARNA